MPFDKDSFLEGYVTGTRLPRVPGRPFRPAPSGLYILTENGEKVLTETTPDARFSVFETDDVYPGAEYENAGYDAPMIQSGFGIKWVRYDPMLEEFVKTNIKYILWGDSWAYSYVFISYDPENDFPVYGLTGVTLSLRKVVGGEESSLIVNTRLWPRYTPNGNAFIDITGPDARYRPLSVWLPFTGTIQELMQYIDDSKKGSPMITE